VVHDVMETAKGEVALDVVHDVMGEVLDQNAQSQNLIKKCFQFDA
jgi:hypothetical protein